MTGAKKAGAKKAKPSAAEPEIIILERTKPEVKESKVEKDRVIAGAEMKTGELGSALEEKPNKPEHNRTDGRKAAWGILIGLIVLGVGLSTWRVMAWQQRWKQDESSTEQVAELTPEEQAAEEERQRQAEAEEAERKRQEEAAEQERLRQEALAREREQRAAQVQQATTSGQPLVALTFDDGPSGATTPRLLDILKEKNVKATFFVLGGMLNSRPDISQRAEAEGHEVESHTMTHRNLDKATLGEIQWEVAVMNQTFMEKLGHVPRLTRPPYGNGIRRAEVTGNIGTPMIYWSVDTEDWRSRNAAAVQERIRQGAFDGAIILMHDIYPSTVDAVAGAIDELRARGYEFVTVEEMAKARGVQMVNGVTYFNFKP